MDCRLGPLMEARMQVSISYITRELRTTKKENSVIWPHNILQRDTTKEFLDHPKEKPGVLGIGCPSQWDQSIWVDVLSLQQMISEVMQNNNIALVNLTSPKT